MANNQNSIKSSQNYLFPFFGVSERVSPETLRADIARLAQNGVLGICIEPGGNKKFGQAKWWEQMDAIMEESEKHGVRVWLQDEPRFPTGSAFGAAADYPGLQKVYLEERHIDTAGPQKEASFIIKNYLDIEDFVFYIKHMGIDGVPTPPVTYGIGDDAVKTYKDDGRKQPPMLLCISACRKNDDGSLEGFIDLTDKLQDGILTWDIPEGQWRIFILYTQQYGVGRENYLNLIDSKATDLLLKKLYEPQYQRYADKFGKTFAGFFSDEPEFGNVSGYDCINSIGRKQMPLPWSRELEEKLKLRFELASLPALWYDCGENTPGIRYGYMDTLTSLYEKNFSKKIGDWCRGHGCEYIGHVVEDMGNHAKLGCGAGHYFRAMAGQDYAGIDVVHQQIRPGLDTPNFAWLAGESGGDFFHYGLAKLGSSAAHIDPLKHGRSICEMFAAFGYSMGLKRQKWLFDHMMVRGISSFIPTWHTINDKGFPNRYDGDPQFRYNHIIAGYVNRVCKMMEDSQHIAPAAVLYHAEAEWMGEFMPFEQPVKKLLQNQIDCDVLPEDVFDQRDYYRTAVENGKIHVNDLTYRCLIIPYSRYITENTYSFVRDCIDNSCTVIFVDALPDRVVGIAGSAGDFTECMVVPLEKLDLTMKEQGLYEIEASGSPDELRYNHFSKDNSEFYFFTNEDINRTIETVISIPNTGRVQCADPLEDISRTIEMSESNGKTLISLALEPYQSLMVSFSEGLVEKPNFKALEKKRSLEILTPWRISCSQTAAEDSFHGQQELSALVNIKKNHPDFSGTIRYESSFKIENLYESAMLSLGEIYETAELWINGKNAGVRICPPYKFDISEFLQIGENSLRIDVTNTLVHERPDMSSAFGSIEPSGLLGPVEIQLFERKINE